jgi:hypothetical protein
LASVPSLNANGFDPPNCCIGVFSPYGNRQTVFRTGPDLLLTPKTSVDPSVPQKHSST